MVIFCLSLNVSRKGSCWTSISCKNFWNRSHARFFSADVLLVVESLRENDAVLLRIVMRLRAEAEIWWSCGASAQGFGEKGARWVVDHKCDRHAIVSLQPRFVFPGTTASTLWSCNLTCELNGLSPKLNSLQFVALFHFRRWNFNDEANHRWWNYRSWRARSRGVGFDFQWYLSKYQWWRWYIQGILGLHAIGGWRILKAPGTTSVGKISDSLGTSIGSIKNGWIAESTKV